MLNFHIISIFPEILRAYFDDSILARAQKNKKINIKIYNPRDFSLDKHKKVDDKPYGGGPGMVMQIQPILDNVEKIFKRTKNKKTKIIIFSPSGKKFTNTEAKKFSKYKNLILICGRYEGIDARVKKILKACLPSSRVDEYSIGDYILTGGEIPAMVFVDAISRQIDGVLGNQDSVEEKRISSSEVYTRPEIFKYKGKKYSVPKVLLSGNHKEIEEWKIKKRGN